MGSSQQAYIDGSRLEWYPHDKGPESLLGEGAFGSVYRGTLDVTDVAIKVIKRSANGFMLSDHAKQAQDAAARQLERELRRLERFKHPHIVQFLGAVADPDSSETLIVTELLSGGSLYDALEVMRNYGKKGEGGAVLEERSFLRIGSGIASGLLYLHNSKFTHGDMKPHNVLLTSTVEILDNGARSMFPKDVQAKIADFGLSRSIGAKTDDLLITTNTQDYGAGPVGTFAYMAPQAFDGMAKMNGEIAKAADIYAFAIVMYELLCGRQPWVAESVRSVWMLCKYVCSDERRPSWGPREQNIRPEYIDFVKRCWAQAWEDRPNAEEVAKQFRMWTRDFKSRESSGGPDRTRMSIDNSDTGSPSVSTAKSGGESVGERTEASSKATVDGDDLVGDLGNDENGAPYLQRINSEVLDEKEAIEVIKRHVLNEEPHDPLDISDSTDTRIDDSNMTMPALPEDRVSEYDDIPARMPGPGMGATGPSMMYPGQSSLDILESAGFNNFVKRVDTTAVCVPEIPALEVPFPAEQPAEKPLENGIAATEEAVNRVSIDDPHVQQDAAYFGRSDANSSKPSIDSFVGGAELYPGESVPNVPSEKSNVIPEQSVHVNDIGTPGLDLPEMRTRPVAWENSLGQEAGGSEIAPSKKESRHESPVIAPVPAPVPAPVLAPVLPPFVPPVTSLSPQQQPVHPHPGLIYPNGPPYSVYGQSMPALSTSVVSTGTLWHSDHRAGVTPGHHIANALNGTSPPQMYGGPGSRTMYGSPHLNVSVVIDAIRSPNATKTLDQYWKDGHAAVIAMAFAKGSSQRPPALAGKTHLDMALDFIVRNKESAEEPSIAKGVIARDLCVAVGSLALNRNDPIDRQTAMEALPITLSTMQTNHNNAAVYSSCCFAMSNLLKITNHIEDSHLRKDVAVWIVHAMSWNLSRGSKMDTLAYTASSAARNYMWLNELNTAMFLLKDEKIFNATPLRKLLTSMSYFRAKDKVLESSLSALAMIAYFPAHRKEVITDKGVQVLLEVLLHIQQRPNAQCLCLCLSILNVLVSEPGATSDKERSLCRQSLLEDNACEAVLQALYYSTEQQNNPRNPRNLGMLQIEEGALAALIALCEFDNELLSAMVKHGAVRYVIGALRGFAVLHVTLIHSSLLANCAIQMCEATYALAKSPMGMKSLRDSEALKFLKTIKKLFRDNEQLISSAGRIISVLSE